MLGPVWTGCSLSGICRRQVAPGTAPHGGEVSRRDGLAPAPALLSSPRRVGPGGSHPSRSQPRLGPARTSFPSLPRHYSLTHSSSSTPHGRHATGPTHRLHGRGHVIVSLRLLGQAGSLQQLLSVPHGRFRGGCRAGLCAPLRESGRRAGMCGGPRTGGGSRNRKRSRPLGCAVPGCAELCCAGLGCAGLGCAGLAAAPSPAGRAPGPTAACAARSLALLPPPAPARREGNEGAEPRCCRGGEGAPLPPRSISR